jgi:hypothetical protein
MLSVLITDANRGSGFGSEADPGQNQRSLVSQLNCIVGPGTLGKTAQPPRFGTEES